MQLSVMVILWLIQTSLLWEGAERQMSQRGIVGIYKKTTIRWVIQYDQRKQLDSELLNDLFAETFHDVPI